MTSPVQFWFDFASPYSYVAAQRVHGYAERIGAPLDLQPFFLAGLVAEQTGSRESHLVRQPARVQYVLRDVERICAGHRLPWRRPSVFPRKSLLAARVALVGLRHSWGAAFVEAAFRANFQDDRDIGDPEILADLLARLEQDADDVLRAAGSQGTKDLLRERTAAATRVGIFGAPSFIVRGELFFGQDRMDEAFSHYERTS